MPAEPSLDPQTWRTMTDEPRRYGFHATLKAPFRPAAGCDETQLTRAFFDFARRGHSPIHIASEIRLLNSFTAIVPRERSAPLAALADRCARREFPTPSGAPMPAEERERRTTGLSASSRSAISIAGGYPYVFADWRFHMTLTGRLAPDQQQDMMLAMLRRSFARMCGEEPIAIDRLGLFKQADANARFRVLHDAEIAS